MTKESDSKHISLDEVVKDRIMFAHQSLMEFKDAFKAMNIKCIKFDFSSGEIYVMDYPPDDSKTDTTAKAKPNKEKDKQNLSLAMQKLLNTVGADASSIKLFVDALHNERKH